MSPEKIQLLLASFDKVREVAKEAATECGMPDRLIVPFFGKPMHPADWILELSKNQDRNPQVLKFMTEHMAEIAPARLQGAIHRGPEKVKKGHGKNAKANRVATA